MLAPAEFSMRMRATQIKASHLQKRAPRGRISIKPLLNTLFKTPREFIPTREYFSANFQTAEKFYLYTWHLMYVIFFLKLDHWFFVISRRQGKKRNYVPRGTMEVRNSQVWINTVFKILNLVLETITSCPRTTLLTSGPCYSDF